MIYLIPLLFVLYLIPFKNKKYNFSLIFITFTLLAIIRYGIGADYFSYKYMYETISTRNIYELLAFKIEIEPLFKIMLGVFSVLGFNYQMMLAVVSTSIFTLTCFWITRNSNNKLLSLVLYISMFYYVWTISALRQSIAIIGAMYLLFDKKQYNLKTKVIGIIILSLFHYSALYLFAILIIERFEVDRKKMGILLITSILISLLPLDYIINLLPNFPLKDKITVYITNPGILNFGYVIRLFMSVIILSVFNKLESPSTKIATKVLFGFYTYFVLSFSPILAGRLSIYTYILIISLIPDIINLFTGDNYKIALSLAIAFSMTYYYKETMGLFDQSSLTEKTVVPTIFNKDEFHFDKYDYYLLNKIENGKNNYNNFLESLNKKIYIGNNPNKMNFVSWNPVIHEYSIYNIDGDFSINYPMRGNPRLYNDVLTNYYDVDGLFPELRFIDVLGEGRSEEELISLIVEHNQNVLNEENVEQKLTDIKFEDLPTETRDIFEYENRVSNTLIYSVDDYCILKTRYYYDTVYVYLNNNLLPLNNIMFDSLDHFGYLGIIDVDYSNHRYRLNKEGKVIWMEKK